MRQGRYCTHNKSAFIWFSRGAIVFHLVDITYFMRTSDMSRANARVHNANHYLLLFFSLHAFDWVRSTFFFFLNSHSLLPPSFLDLLSILQLNVCSLLFVFLQLLSFSFIDICWYGFFFLLLCLYYCVVENGSTLNKVSMRPKHKECRL